MIRRFRHIRAYARDRKGVAAVEFALIAAPLIFMIMACLELALVVLVSVSLENAVFASSRKIRTDNNPPTTAQAFREDICANMTWLSGSCLDNLHVDVRTFDSFAEAASPPVLIVEDEDTGDVILDDDNMGYAVGDGSTIQLVRAYYTWNLLTPLLKSGLATLTNGQAVLSTARLFRNEPFDSEGGT